jgi:hypothetical protein
MKGTETRAAIIRRIVREAGTPELIDILAERISPTDLQSLLLEVYRRRAARISVSCLAQQYAANRFVKLANTSPQEVLEFDRLAYSLLPAGFEAVELSPLAPLGSCSVLGTVDQNNTVATIRNTEVCADSTNVLALECARRRQDKARVPGDTRLCASHRLLRGQVFSGAASFAHFRAFCMCTAGRDRGSHRFEIATLHEHVDFYLRLLRSSREIGAVVGAIRVTFTPFAEGWPGILEHEVMPELAALHKEIAFSLDVDREAGRAYYSRAGFQIYASDRAGTEFFLVDGGFTDWTEKLLNNRKERLLISGLGTERFLVCFRGEPEGHPMSHPDFST